MTTTIHAKDTTFTVECEPIDVTSMHRPDVGLVIVDKAGHRHQWQDRDVTRVNPYYSPDRNYHMPTLVWVKDGEEYYEDDDEPHDVGHHECRECGEHVVPPFTADTTEQYIAGPKTYRINGEWVSPDEFERRYLAAQGH